MRKYYGLAPRVRIEYVRDLFGAPTFQDQVLGEQHTSELGEPEQTQLSVYLWKLADDGYLQVVADTLDTVRRYSLTTTSRRFHPRIPIGAPAGVAPRFWVKLGVTPFARLGWQECMEQIRWCQGAHRLEYSESYYFGNPGGYLTWVCSSNDAGRPGLASFIHSDLPDHSKWDPWEGWLDQLEPRVREELAALRRSSRINTVTVDFAPVETAGVRPFGPDLDTVRLLGTPYRQAHIRRLAQAIRRRAMTWAKSA